MNKPLGEEPQDKNASEKKKKSQPHWFQASIRPESKCAMSNVGMWEKERFWKLIKLDQGANCQDFLNMLMTKQFYFLKKLL